jgi:hypothetical protein
LPVIPGRVSANPGMKVVYSAGTLAAARASSAPVR